MTAPPPLSQLNSTTTRPRRSGGYGSYFSDDSNNSIPDMIMSASLQSFPESDNYSMSSSIQSLSPVSSPRSIFGSYWSSPMHKNTLEETNANDDEARLQMLQLPLVNDLDTDGADSSSASANKIFQAPIISVEQKTCFDDASIDYQAALPSTPTRTPRRKILPTPPPPTAISSSLIPPMRKFQHQPFLQRKSFSATALLRGSHPHQSCLRKSRYSCSAIVTGSVTATSVMGRLHHGSCNHGYHDLYHHNPQPAVISRGNRPDDPRDELKKSVSFYSQVSVLEFSVPPDQRRSQKGWSDYFA
mmetsp:Transcript_13147/g.24186  ORF Transcript_13147/g.24186 Transcript_13147/m.24186 type:complete len:301 (+) Transcript_13147:51-953(+)